MKKFLALLLALAMVFALAACGEPAADPTDAPSGDDTPATDAPEGGDSTATGSVYYLNFKPEQDAQWQELAELYTAETGVTVKVVTAASGEYETYLTSEMAKEDAPTTAMTWPAPPSTASSPAPTMRSPKATSSTASATSSRATASS